MFCVIYRAVKHWYVAIIGDCLCVKRNKCNCNLYQRTTKRRAEEFAAKLERDTSMQGKPLDVKVVHINDQRINHVGSDFYTCHGDL